ncbi:MAG: 2,3-bisphosphoglycerate-independent phosphoglycerate mutase [Mariprofundales bacterium]
MSIRTHFSGHKPVLLIILDGWGLGDGGDSDAIAQARTPTMDNLQQHYAKTQLYTHGEFVGLPNQQDLGGSEVGHLTMGAGTLMAQGPKRIATAIADGSFQRAPVLQAAFTHINQSSSKTLHLLGLLSDGNIHAHIDHFIAVLKAADLAGVNRVRIHALLDGRDVEIQSAQKYVEHIELFMQTINNKAQRDYALASGGGREAITMDRDNNWDKVQAGWQAHVHGEATHHFPSAQAAISFFRQQQPNLVDQDMPAFVIDDVNNCAIGKMQDGDAVINMNFRSDRAQEITEAFCLDDFSGFERGERPELWFASMMVYDAERDLPKNQIMGSTSVANPFGKRILELGLRQFRLTETQKFPHVTFFFNGGYRTPLDNEMEEYKMIPSDKGISFADAPQMQAFKLADTAEAFVRSGKFDFGMINFANADMVGHSGNMQAAITAVEAVDTALHQIIKALQDVGGMALITADHGNADVMRSADGCNISTKHSINPVPCIIFDPDYTDNYQLYQPNGSGIAGREPGLYNIAATLFDMLGIAPPSDIFPSLLIQ